MLLEVYQFLSLLLPSHQSSIRSRLMKNFSSYHLLLLLLLIFLATNFISSEGCHEEERIALLEIKDSIPGSLLEWEGKDCCNWTEIGCDNYSRVVRIDLVQVIDFVEEWYPNATMFRSFKELRSLDLSRNMMRGSGTELLQVICQLKFMESLNLEYNSLEGVVPPCLGNVTSLEDLSLGHNKFRGDISKLSNLNALNVLRLSNNGFQGNILSLFDQNYSSRTQDSSCPNASVVSPLKKLQQVDLSNNQLSGDGCDLFQAICQLNSLNKLDLSGNLLEGRIHPCLGSMHALQSLNLAGNLFEGSIPPNLDGMYSLTKLDLSRNQFHDNFPTSLLQNMSLMQELYMSHTALNGRLSFSIFANLTNLAYLDLSNNKQLEVETESPSWVPSFKLTSLNLSNCALNKHSGSIIPTFLSNQSFEELDLSHNSLRGSIPYWLLENTVYVLWLQSNMFDRLLLPSYLNESSRGPAALDISDNRVFGTLPLTSAILSFYYLNMSSNFFRGTIPSSYSLLRILDLSNNSLTGNIHGLTVGETKLVYLGLSYNILEGEILPRNSSMTELRYLKIQNNRFTGSIPFILSKSPLLVLLDLRHNYLMGNISSSLPVLFNLRALLLGGNCFAGNIPTQLCQMNNLQFIDLSYNNLSGNIPSCLNNITFMKRYVQSNASSFGDLPQAESPSDYPYLNSVRVTTDFTTKGISYSFEGSPLTLMSGIDVSCNRLSGGIPSEIGDLRNLHALNLSNNRLTGSIPTSFQDMENLESLDLSYNYLSGALPVALTRLHSLSTFSVAFNNLSGKIPFDQQFSTFEQSSFVGNVGLCGEQLERKCSINKTSGHTSPAPYLKEEEDDSPSLIENPLFFYSWVAISYASGFWTIVALLIFNKKLRHKFFRITDMLIGSRRCYG